MPDISVDALQMELARLLRLLSDARAAGDLPLVELVTAETAKCVLKVQQQQHSAQRQGETDKQS